MSINIENKTLLECPDCGQVYLVKVADLEEGNGVQCPECENKSALREFKEFALEEGVILEDEDE